MLEDPCALVTAVRQARVGGDDFRVPLGIIVADASVTALVTGRSLD
jgi:hypothetical protein